MLLNNELKNTLHMIEYSLHRSAPRITSVANVFEGAPGERIAGFLSFSARVFAMKLLWLAVFVLLFPAAHAAECVCVKDPHPSQEKFKADLRRAYDEARAVFTGKVIAIDAYTIKFRLAKRWKGDARDEIVISTGAVPGHDGAPLPDECNYHFRSGAEYLVFAQEAAGKMRVYICSALPIKDAAKEESGLDEIRKHDTPGGKQK